MGATTLSIHPLPDADEDTQIGNSPFVYGYYGLEETFLRGMVSIHTKATSLSIATLSVTFKGLHRLSYSNEHGERVCTSKTLVSVTEVLLGNEAISAQTIDIPFQLALPEPPAKYAPLVKTAVRTANLLPPSAKTSGYTVYNLPFDTAVEYTLHAELIEHAAPSILSFVVVQTPPSTKARVEVTPFLVHDPRQLPIILQPDSKRWRSAPGDSPVEYELEIGATTIGPNDSFEFRYRLAVARDAAAKGVKVKKVCLLLREHRSLGTSVRSIVPPQYKCVRSSTEITRWEFEETEPPSAKDLMAADDEFDDQAGNVAFKDFAFEIEGDGDVRSDTEALQQDSLNLVSSWSGNAGLRETNSTSGGNPILTSERVVSVNVKGDPSSNSLPSSDKMDQRGEQTLYQTRLQQLQAPSSAKSPRLNGRKIKFQTRQIRSKHFNSAAQRSGNLSKSTDHVELTELRPRRKLADGMTFFTPSHLQSINENTYDVPRARGGFSDGWSGGPGGDGLYVENEVTITMPPLSSLMPCSFKAPDATLLYPDPHNGFYATVPYVEVKHTLQVRIELHKVEKAIVHECWAVVTSVGKRECDAVLDNRIDLMPTLDYDKVFGAEVWVPPYQKVDPFIDGRPGRGGSEENVEEGGDDFFGSLRVKSLPPVPKAGPSSLYERAPPPLETDAVFPPRSRSASLAPSLSGYLSSSPHPPSLLGTPFTADNYFQKRPSISSILSFTSFNLPNNAQLSPNPSDIGSGDETDDLHASTDGGNDSDPDMLQTLTVDTPYPMPFAASTSSAIVKRSKLHHRPVVQKHIPTPITTLGTRLVPPPRLMSAHSLIASDASVASQDPSNQRLLQELQAYKRNMHYPQKKQDESPQTSEGFDEDEVEMSAGGTEQSGLVRHPLQGDDEVEARRRVAALKPLSEQMETGVVLSDEVYGGGASVPSTSTNKTALVSDGELPPSYDST